MERPATGCPAITKKPKYESQNTMKVTQLKLLAIAFAAIYGLASCGGDNHDDHDHDEQAEHSGDDHEGHDHDDHEGHDHDDHEGHDHGDHDGHDHENIIAGPNGGRVLTAVEPHAEFFVTDERKVQIAFVDDDLKPVAAAEQTVSVIAGDRSNPTNLAFAKSGDVLISDKALPSGNDFPVVVQIKTDAGAEAVRERFNLNLADCPTCDYKEYACTCLHHDDE